MSSPHIFLSADTAAQAAGAEDIARALTMRCEGFPGASLHRTSSRGMCWLEPLLEVQTEAGRMGFGPVTLDQLPALWEVILRLTSMSANDLWVLEPSAVFPSCQGLMETLPYLSSQSRQIFARAGLTEPLSLEQYAAHGGWTGLKRALEQSPDECIQELLASGLRGRGGAAFPAGIKWRTVAQTLPADGTTPRKYVVCNADEGDSGTFADRLVLEGDPFLLIEGMIIAGLAVGAEQGYIYVRSEYPRGLRMMQDAIGVATRAGYLGASVLESGKRFRLEVRKAAGSYVCGEETAMLESLEGRRGLVRSKPPLPAHAGLFGMPTLIQNVLTLASVPWILAHGGAAYRALGVRRSTGTFPFQLAGNILKGGIVEVPFGISLRTLIYEFGGGTRSGRPVKAIQVGGPLGAYLPPAQWDVPMDYESFTHFGAVLGHGGIVVHDDQANLASLARYAFEFCALESCGKCTPCRVGSIRGVEVMDRIQTAPKEEDFQLLHDLCDTLKHASLCAMGGMTPFPVLSALEHYPQDFAAKAASA